jgi:hypothetical protein
VLQDREVRPVGGNTSVKVDVRIIAATNRDLRAEIEAGRFRRDLFYRLNVVEVRLPALRDRREDIPYLVAAFVRDVSERLQKAVAGLTPGAERLLMAAPWDGNVRELRNVVERACIMADGDFISERELAARVLEPHHAVALRGGHPPAGGARGAQRTAGVPHRPPHGPVAQRQVRREGSLQRRPHLVGQGEPADRGRLRRAAPAACCTTWRARSCSCRTAMPGADPRVPPADSRGHRDGVAQPVRAPHVHPRAATPPSASSTTPQFTVIDCPSFHADPAVHGTNSEVFILLNFAQAAGAHRRHQLRRRDQEVDLHGDELPAAAAATSCRCTARPTSGRTGDVALFFGLSGTGKTTLSSDPSAADRRRRARLERRGVFNFEGGCYAKMIRLSAEAEPQIYATTRRFGTVLENVVDRRGRAG